MRNGFFITFEGGEGAGKSTQLDRLAEALRGKGHDVVVTREPGGVPAAEALRDVFIDSRGHEWPVAAQVLLMFTARAVHTAQRIGPALERGQIVLCDRYTDSTRAYQGAALGYDRGAIETVKSLSIGDLEPDLTLIFDIDPREGLARAKGRAGAQDTFEDNALAFHEKLRQGFLDIARDNPARCVVIDAARDADAVSAQVEKEVFKRL